MELCNEGNPVRGMNWTDLAVPLAAPCERQGLRLSGVDFT